MHLLPGLQAPDDVIVFDGRCATDVEPVDIADDAGRVVGEVGDCFGGGVLRGATIPAARIRSVKNMRRSIEFPFSAERN